MGTKLLIRNYNVGCGDCTYIRIPNDGDGFHILIDCGSKEAAGSNVMRDALANMESELPPVAPGESRKRLDLVVVTHRHEDHIKGFDPEFFANIKIENIWLSAAMDESHEQATGTHALHSFAGDSMQKLADSGSALSPELADLVAGYADMYGIGNRDAMTTLIETLPQASGIEPKFVHAGQTSTDLGVTIPDGIITVLGPEKDIDHYYLGKELDASLRSIKKVLPEPDPGLTVAAVASDSGEGADESAAAQVAMEPDNISSADFRVLKSRLLSNGLAFAVDDSSIQNNVSTVVLIEWRKRRLLFVGDGEWHGEFHEGRKNGTWNVMWKLRHEHLAKPLDFLKVGHHGSKNATPWNPDADEADGIHEVNQILNAILPLPAAGTEPTAQCVVSTKRKQYVTIPDGPLMVELGKRVANTQTYEQDFKKQAGFDPEADIYNYSVEKKYSGVPKLVQVGEKDWLNKPQPQRTDMQSRNKGDKEMSGDIEFIDIELDPG